MRAKSATLALLCGAALCAALSAPAIATEVDGYGFPAAAQEITQLYWLAETAAACGWASSDDSQRFKLFTLRFLSAHLSDTHRAALQSLVSRPDYESGVRDAAQDGARENCESNRWHAGWVTFKAAADENEQRY
jgi:hypothetical protein